MKNKRLLAVACACAMTTALCGGALVAHADTGSGEQAAKNYFGAPNCDALLQEGETEYDFKTGGVRIVGHINGSVKAKKEADDNVYLELGKDGNNAFWWSGLKLTDAGDYKVSFDVKHAEGWTGNSVFAGYRFWSSSIPENEIVFANVTQQVNAANADTWTHIETTYTVSAAALTGVDSIQFGYDADVAGVNFLMLDNIVIEYIVPDDNAPTLIGNGTADWREETATDVTFGVDLKGNDLLSVTEKSTGEQFAEGFTYVAAENKITFTSDFCKDLGEGSHELILATDGGELGVVITVYYKTAQIPDSTDGYELEASMLGGDFESYEVGLKFSDAQTDEAWGSLANYDDPGMIVDDNGNHALRLGRHEGSNKMYSSAFCMTSPDIQQDDILTLKYSYKFVGENALDKVAGKNITSAFIGSSNTGYHQVNLVSKNESTIEGNDNVQSWAVKYSQGENGYTDVEVSFIVDFAFMNATNSLRFLYEIVDGVELYVDNVELVRWVEEGSADAEVPVMSGETLAFDGKNQNDIALTVDLKDYNVSSLKCGATVLKANVDYALSADETTLTVKKSFLATLDNGKHVLTLTTLGGTCTVEITVTNAQTAAVTNDDDGANVGLIVGLCVAGAAVVAAGAATAVILTKKKKNGKKDNDGDNEEQE